MQLQNRDKIKTRTSDLNAIVRTKFDVQHLRMILESRMRSSSSYAPTYEIWIKQLSGKDGLEVAIHNAIWSEVLKYPVHKWIISNKGLSYDLAGQLIGLIGDIKKFDNISKLWAYAGFAVVDVCTECGKRYYPLSKKGQALVHISKRLMEIYENKIVKDGKSDFSSDAKEMMCNCKEPNIVKKSQRKIKGCIIDYNPVLKTVCWKVGEQFIRQGDFYRKLYDEFRLTYENREDLKEEIVKKSGRKTKGKNGDVVYTKGTKHIHQMAMRKMIKVFLAHLWIEWRKLEKLPVSMPYAIDILKHTDYI